MRVRWWSEKDSGRKIQRLLRGKLGRMSCSALRHQKVHETNTLFFEKSAQTVQRFWRGYWSRKYLHDFYARKAYLQRVSEVGNRTVQHLKETNGRNMQAKAEEDVRVARTEFGKICRDVHHLVSTRAMPGVYNPPYSDALPSAFGKPIEQHLRDETRVEILSLRRPQPHKLRQHSATPGSRAANVGKAQTIQGPFRSRAASVGRAKTIQGPFRSKHQIEVANAKAFNNFRSVQSQSPYDAVQRDECMQQRLEKLTRTAPNDFGIRRMEPAMVKPSVHAETAYQSRPFEFRDEYKDLPKIKGRPGFF